MEIYTFTQADIDSLHQLRLYAEANPYSMDDMLDLMNKQATIPGHIPERTRYMLDHKIVFTIDWQPIGDTRHMSISRKDGTEPNYSFIQFICEQLGFETEPKDCIVYKEGENALSILEPIDKEKFEEFQKNRK